VATHLPPPHSIRTRSGRTLPLAKKALTAAFLLYLTALLAGVSPSCGAGTRRATAAERERVFSGEADGGRELRTTMALPNGRARCHRVAEDGAGGVLCPSH